MTGNKSDQIGNTKLMSFGFENQGFNILKEESQITMNMFGVTVGTYNRLEEVYMFAMRTKNTMENVKDRLAKQIDEEQYIKDMKQAVENAKNMARARSEKSYSDFGDKEDFD